MDGLYTKKYIKKACLILSIIILLVLVGCSSVDRIDLGDITLSQKYYISGSTTNEGLYRTANNYRKNLEVFYETYQGNDIGKINQAYELLKDDMNYIQSEILGSYTEYKPFDTVQEDNIPIELKSAQLEYSKEALELYSFILNRVELVIGDGKRELVTGNKETKLSEGDIRFLESLKIQIIDFADTFYV